MSIHKILVGVDLSPESELAAMQAMSLARRGAAGVVLVHVSAMLETGHDVPETIRGTAEYAAHARARLAEDRAALEAMRQRLLGQGVEVSHVLIDGMADTALADCGHELRADLIVVGSHGRTGLMRFLIGSVAEKTARLASSNVLVARGARDAAEGGFRRIVVGTDYSPLGDLAVTRALEVAAAGAHVHVVHAWQLVASAVPENLATAAELRIALTEDAQRSGQERLRTWQGARPDVVLVPESCEAPAQQALVDRAVRLGADLIVVGSHGRRGVRRLLLGSVAETVVRHAPCSVLVTR
jgi:nucleotide-binding universal stress UspA family protein